MHLAEPLAHEKARAAAEAVARDAAAPHRDDVDQAGRWPKESMASLARAGLLGLNAPRRVGGHGLGLRALFECTEALGRVCPSSALCFGMHCVATAVVSAKATPAHDEKFLSAIAAGRHVTTLALSEAGTGSHFYLPSTRIRRDGDAFVLDGAKTFVTNGGHADSYVVSTAALEGDLDPGRFSCVLLDGRAPGLAFGDAWNGFGMRGNESRTMRISSVRVDADRLLGEVGDQTWYVFEVVAPYFLMAMSGTYVGLGRGILDELAVRLKARSHVHVGQALADQPLLQHRYAELWMELESARALALHAAQLGDEGAANALPYVLASKARVGDAVVKVANEAMTLAGGAAYQENGLLARFLRDARAAPVMSPTTDLLKQWAGRALLERPLL